MQISTTKESLVPQLALVSGAADTRGIVPALSNVLLKVSDQGNLALICSDTGMLARAVTPVEVKECGEVAVDVARFHALIRAVPDKQAIEISTESDKNILLVKSGRSRFRLPTIPASDYPRLTPANEERVAITMSARRLAEMIADTASSMADADLRPFLNGTLFTLDQTGLFIVATDGCRLAVSHEPIPGADTLVPRNIIVPRKTVLLAKKLLGQGGNVKVTFGATNIQFQYEDGGVLFGNGIDGKFPAWSAIIPVPKVFVTASTDRLSNALTMLAVAPDQKSANDALKHKLDLSISKTTLVLQRGDSGVCEVESESSVDDKCNMAFNINYLTDAVATIRAVSEEIEIGYIDFMKAVTIRPKGKPYPLCVVMPMKG